MPDEPPARTSRGHDDTFGGRSSGDDDDAVDDDVTGHDEVNPFAGFRGFGIDRADQPHRNNRPLRQLAATGLASFMLSTPASAAAAQLACSPVHDGRGLQFWLRYHRV